MPGLHAFSGQRGARRKRQKLIFSRKNPQGFTLIELMVAMALLGILTSMIYGLFHTTSQTLMEVESLAETHSIARFALEHVQSDLQAAGSQSSPSSGHDPWVLNGSRFVSGLVPYSGWQGSSPLPDDVSTPTSALSQLADANSKSRFDGIIVVGAYDIPQNVMIQRVQSGENGSAVIAPHVRGITRLIQTDPFNTSATVPASIETQLNNGPLLDTMSSRLLRITDRQGFLQFTTLEGAATTAVSEPDMADSTVQLALGKVLAASIDSSYGGVDEANEDDVEYEAAFLDAYWYHVITDPFDSTNFQLVRDRLDLTDNAFIPPAGTTIPNLDPADLVVSGERIVIANRVVDFRVWFDCGDINGNLTNVTWHEAWEIPPNTCLNNSPQLARLAHTRLSIRTENERSNRPHLTLNAAWPGFETPDTRMQTYDIAPSVVGAASVVTVQGTVELTNFAQRNLR